MTLPVVVVGTAVLLSPSLEEVRKSMDAPASPVDSGSTATRPSGDSRKSSWDESTYNRYDFVSFFKYPPALERIDPADVDYPLLQAALFYATNAARFNNNRKVLRYDRGARWLRRCCPGDRKPLACLAGA